MKCNTTLLNNRNFLLWSQGPAEPCHSLALLCKPHTLTYMKDARTQERYRRTITPHHRRAPAFVSVRVSIKIIRRGETCRSMCTGGYWWRKWRHTWEPEAVVNEPRMHIYVKLADIHHARSFLKSENSLHLSASRGENATTAYNRLTYHWAYVTSVTSILRITLNETSEFG